MRLWTGGAGVAVGGRHRHDLPAVAVSGLEDSAGDVGPAPHGARAGAAVGAVGAVGGLRVQHVEDGRGHVAREGQAAQIVVRDRNLGKFILRVGDAVGQTLHGFDEVVSLTDDPTGAHDVVARAAGHGDVTRCLVLAVDEQRAKGLPIVVRLGRAVEHQQSHEPVPSAKHLAHWRPSPYLQPDSAGYDSTRDRTRRSPPQNRID